MAREEIKTKTSIGSSSLILIFIVLCLTTFGLLSLSSAKGDKSLAEKNADSIKTYYEADSKGEEFLAMVDTAILDVFQQKSDTDDVTLLLKEQLGGYYEVETGTIMTEIPMDYGQALHIELAMNCDENVRYDIVSWRVLNVEELEIDNSLQLYTGE